MALTSGQSLQKGQYTIERELGYSRFSMMYLATAVDGERWVIKVLDPLVLAGLTDTEKARQETLFWQEATKLAQCRRTSHIARAKLPFKEGDLLCLPVEYLGGDSLADRQEAQLMESVALSYIQQLGEALAVVHEQGLVHRDIRPANIFFRDRGDQRDVVLTNFELAVECDTDLTRTRSNELTDGFSPLELYTSGQAVGPYTDVYGLAATLYELLTGMVPLSAKDRKVTGQALPSPQNQNPAISGKTAKAIMQGMALLATKRPQSVADWLQQLQPKPWPIPLPSLAIKSWNWQTIWAALGVILALAVALGVVPRLNQESEFPEPESSQPEEQQ